MHEQTGLVLHLSFLLPKPAIDGLNILAFHIQTNMYTGQQTPLKLWDCLTSCNYFLLFLLFFAVINFFATRTIFAAVTLLISHEMLKLTRTVSKM